MKMWNTHINAFPAYADAYAGAVCERFVDRFAGDIVKKGLRYNLLLHLLTMWEFGVLRSEEVSHLISIVDAEQLLVKHSHSHSR